MSTSPDYLLAPGQLLADTYRIERPIGKGGMGQVYEATHARLAGRYAVKLLLQEIGQHEEVLIRFKQEAEVTSRLRHPNIVQVIDFAKMPDGTPFMVMEFLEGHDLAHELRKVGRMPLARAAAIIDQVSMGLAAAHAENIVHRDLKPANIFLTPLRGRNRELAKVVDFGISKVRTATTGLTRTQSVIGTPQYMAPEQARGLVREIDGRTDQFALGSIMYEMLAGRAAFEGEEVSSILYQIVHEEPPELASLGVPGLAGVEAVLRKAMSKASADRFPTVNDFAVALEAAVAAAGDAAFAPGAAALRRAELMATPATRPEAVQKTTLRDSAGEVAAQPSGTLAPRSAGRTAAIVVSLAAALGVGAFAALRAGAPAHAPSSAVAPVAAPAPVAPPPAPVAPPPAPVAAPAPVAPAPVAPPPAPVAAPSAPEPEARPTEAPGKKAAPAHPSRKPKRASKNVVTDI
jgi:serine/threonine-protein kinase